MKLIYTYLAITISSFSFGQKRDNEINVDKVEQYIKAHFNNSKFNGNVLITKGDSVLYSNSFGLTDRESNIKHTDSTKFLIGSITKPFTALAILILEKEGKLNLEDKLSKYFPSFESAAKITIDQLLTHTSGIADYRILSDWKADSKSDNTTPHSTVAKMSKKPLLFEPGERFRYSNVGYILLGLIIEKVSEQSFANFIQEKILTPLELKNTGVINNKSIVSNLASGYITNPRETLKAEYINYKQPFTSGNIYSTTHDLWKFTQAVMLGKLISVEKTEQIFESGPNYGYGWGIRNFEGIKAYGHYGGMNGFVGAITFIPEGEYFIYLLTNDDNTPKVRITTDLVSMILGKDIPLPEKTKLIDLSQKASQEIIGNYLVKDADTMKVFENNGKLYIQENGQVKHEMFPYNNYKFSFDLLEFNAVFENLENDKTQLLKFVARDTILSAKRITN
jgi:CubicO group peptidase (beta-lactamase class C family)